MAQEANPDVVEGPRERQPRLGRRRLNTEHSERDTGRDQPTAGHVASLRFGLSCLPVSTSLAVLSLDSGGN